MPDQNRGRGADVDWCVGGQVPRKSYPIPFSPLSRRDSPPSSSLVLTAPLHWSLFIFPSLPHSSLCSYLTILTPHPSSLSRVSTLYPTIVFYLFSSLLPVPALWPFLSHLSISLSWVVHTAAARPRIRLARATLSY